MESPLRLINPQREAERHWVHEALEKLAQEAARSADTHLLKLNFPGFHGIDFYFKDEAAHPTGSLKHRLARSLFLYALCNGRLRGEQAVVDASSGSTAISEAWFARLLGLSFTAVMPAATAPGKIRDVQALGGRCDLVDDPAQVHARAAAHAAHGACHLDQFGLAERATDWRGNNNIAESIIGQLAREPSPEPTWIVCGAGTGGTSATIGRYLRYRRLATRLCVAEPTGSGFVQGWRTREPNARASRPTLIEGIGRPRVEPGFLFDVVDHVIEVPDTASIAAAWLLEDLLGRRYGGSSGTNLVACLQLASTMRARGERGSIVSLLCDRGERYAETLFDPAWLAAHDIDLAPARAALKGCIESGRWMPPPGSACTNDPTASPPHWRPTPVDRRSAGIAVSKRGDCNDRLHPSLAMHRLRQDRGAAAVHRRVPRPQDPDGRQGRARMCAGRTRGAAGTGRARPRDAAALRPGAATRRPVGGLVERAAGPSARGARADGRGQGIAGRHPDHRLR